jgi:signal transduction histidine kinase
MSLAYYLSLAVPASALVSYAVLMILVVRRRAISRIHLTFALYLSTMVIWSGSSLMMRLDPAHALMWGRITTLTGASVMPLSWFAFSRAFTGLTPFSRQILPGIIATAIVAMATASGLMVTSVGIDPVTRLVNLELGPAVLLYGFTWIIYLGWSSVILTRAYRRAREPAWRNRIRYPLIGLTFVMFGVTTNAIPLLRQYPLDIAANLANAALLAYAIARYQLVDMALVVRRTLSWAIGVGALALGYAVSLLLIQFVFVNQAIGVGLLGLGVALALLVLNPGLRRWIQQAVERVISRETYNLHLMLEEVSRTVTRLRPLPELAELILNRVVSTLALKQAIFLARDESSGEIHKIVAVGTVESDLTVTWRPNHPLHAYFVNHNQPMLSSEIELLPQIKALWAHEREDFDKLQGQLFVPVLSNNRLLAVLVFGEKLNGQPFVSDDISALSTLANQTAIAIDNARLYQEVRSEATKLVLANEELRRLDKAKDEFIQNISHELRTPLMLIKGYIELMQRGVLGHVTPEQADALRTVLQRSNAIIEMVNDILALTREQSEPLRLETLHLGQIMDASVALAFAAAESAGIRITVSSPADLPPIIGDARRLGQVLDNLLGNAIKFSPAGGEVNVTVVQHEARVSVNISDQGIGISATDLPRIWERFYQAEASATRRFAGSGLGLAIVKRIVEAHGGEVGVSSTPGQGSTFSFTLLVQTTPAPQIA